MKKKRAAIYARVSTTDTIMAGLAEFESALIGERVRAGMERARSERKRISRPAIAADVVKKIQKLRREGKSLNYIETKCRMSRPTVVKCSQKIA